MAAAFLRRDREPHLSTAHSAHQSATDIDKRGLRACCWQRDLGFRFDHLLCSPEAADRLQGGGVDRWARGEEKASDHAPTWVELE